MSSPVRRVERVALPSGAGPPYRVFVNGQEIAEGREWFVEGETIRFADALRPRPNLGFWRKLVLSLGVGVYGDLRGDTLDITFVTVSGEGGVSAAHPVLEADPPTR